MKHIYLTILLQLSSLSIFAQAPLVQSGMVREQNSNKKPIADAQIIFENAVPATSEQSGKFRLAFSGKKAGDWVFMTEITKKGYELVNDKELEKIKLGSSEQLGTDVILAKAGVIDAAKKEYWAYAQQLAPMIRSGGYLLADNTVSHQDQMKDFLEGMAAWDGQTFFSTNIDGTEPLNGLLIALKC